MFSEERYRPRIIDDRIELYLSLFGAVCIEGPKWCGKTWSSEYHSKSKIMIGDPANNFQNRRLAELSPLSVLEGETPRLIDEWQEVPSIWDAVRYEVDNRSEKGQFVLTGSATPNHKGVLHSGAGRIGRLRMRPMSLYESGDSSGKVSLKDIMAGKARTQMTGEVKLRDLFGLIVRGGWPENIGVPEKKYAVLPAEYIRAIIEDDVFRIDGVKRDIHKMQLLLKSLARNESTSVTNKTLKNDIAEKGDTSINIDTVAEYLDIFKRLYLTDNVSPFSTRIRSSVRVKQSEKRYFSDPSLACVLLGATADKLINDLETAGLLFESMCIRDLRIYAEGNNAKLFHYHDYNEKEIDAVIEDENGDWHAFEIKLGANKIDEGAENLLAIVKSIKSEKGGIPPKSMCIVCGMSNAAYMRPDGVFVVPITALRN